MYNDLRNINNFTHREIIKAFRARASPPHAPASLLISEFNFGKLMHINRANYHPSRKYLHGVRFRSSRVALLFDCHETVSKQEKVFRNNKISSVGEQKGVGSCLQQYQSIGNFFVGGSPGSAAAKVRLLINAHLISH